MDHTLTKKIQEWLDQPAAERDYNLGLTFLLKLSNNSIMCHNLEKDPAAKADFIEYQIRKYQAFRLKQMTHDEVEQMRTQVDRIAQSHNLASSTSQAPVLSSSPESKTDSFRSGKRADHDSLPAEIQSLYVENADIMHKMRDLHLKLRNLSLENVTCPDSERYPFLKEIIDLDKRYHKNWHIYDTYVPTSATILPASAEIKAEDSRMEQKQLYRQINLTKGRYKKAPSDDLKSKIVALYNQLTSPVSSLTDDLITLGILDPE